MGVTAPGPPKEGQTGPTHEDVFEVSLPLRGSLGGEVLAEMQADVANIWRNGVAIALALAANGAAR